MWKNMRNFVSRKNLYRLVFDPQLAIFSMFVLLIAELVVNILVIKKIKCKYCWLLLWIIQSTSHSCSCYIYGQFTSYLLHNINFEICFRHWDRLDSLHAGGGGGSEWDIWLHTAEGRHWAVGVREIIYMIWYFRFSAIKPNWPKVWDIIGLKYMKSQYF